MNKIEKTEIEFALIAALIAIVNIVLVLVGASSLFIKPFSICLSLIIFYFAWSKITEYDIFDKIKLLLQIYNLNREAKNEAKKIIENAKK